MPAKWAQAALIAALIFFGYLFTLNPAQVSFRIYPGRFVNASLALLLFLTFLAGFGVAFLTGIFREAFFSLRSWRQARSDERRQKAQQLFREGRGHLTLGKHRSARRLLQKAYRKSPGEQSIALEIARAEAGDGRLEAAERRLKALLEDDPANVEILSLLAEVSRRRGDFDGQVTALSQWIEADPNHLLSLAALRDVYRKAGHWAEAARVQEKLLARTEGRDARHRERRILSELQLKGAEGQPPAKAAASLRRIVEDDEEFAPAYAALADVLAGGGEEAEGLNVLLKGYKRTGQKGLLLKIEAMRIRQGGAEELLKLYRKLAKKDAGVALLQARLLVSLNRPEEALEALGKSPPSSPTARWITGEALFRLRSFDGAARSFRQSLRAEEGAPPLAFRCHHCGRAERSWGAACPACGTFDSLDLDLAELPPTFAPASVA